MYTGTEVTGLKIRDCGIGVRMPEGTLARFDGVDIGRTGVAWSVTERTAPNAPKKGAWQHVRAFIGKLISTAAVKAVLSGLAAVLAIIWPWR